MLDQLLSSLKSQVGPELISKLGLSQDEADKSVEATSESVQEVVGQEMGAGKVGMLANLFSDNDNGDEENGIMDKIGDSLTGKLTSKVGLSSEKAGGIKAMVMPMVMKLITSKIGGNSGMLSSLFGGGGDANGDGKPDSMMDGIKGKLGGLFG